MILDDLVSASRQNMLKRQIKKPLVDLKKEVKSLPNSNTFSFENNLYSDKISVIAEIKQASPSKGTNCVS